MRELRYASGWRLGGYTLLVLALAAMLVPGGAMALPSGPYDKLAHAVGFFGLTFWFAGVYRREHYGWIACGMLLFGVLSELSQALLTRTRTADLLDFAADATGVALALLTARGGADRWTVQVERLLVRP